MFKKVLGFCAIAALGAGCDTTDGDNNPDGGDQVVGERPAAGQYDFVLSTMTLPVSATQSAELARDYGGANEDPDNALGNVLGAVSGAGIAIQPSLDKAVNAGKALVLLSTTITDSEATMVSYAAETKVCCADPTDDAACAAEALTECFSGSASFTKDSSNTSTFTGDFAGSTGTFGPATLRIALPLDDSSGVLELNLDQAYVTGTFSEDGTEITDGTLTGVITQQKLNDELIPGLTEVLNNMLVNENTEQSSKDQLLDLFDTDDNGEVSEEEIKTNALVSAVLGGDVDVDGDGENELSVGVGFTAVSATLE